MRAPLRFAGSIIVRPIATWRSISLAHDSFATLFFGYVVPLNALGPLATFVAEHYVGFRIDHVVYRSGAPEALAQAAFKFVFALVGLMLVTLLVDALAPAFGARRHFRTSFRIAAFAYTPVWLASLAVLVPALGFLELAALAYVIFLLRAGIVALMGIAPGRAAALALCAVVGTVAIAVGFGQLSWLLTHRG